jgi:integrase/recombinase XerD
VSAVPETTLPGLVAELVASRRAGGYRFKVQERVLRQFAGHCQREGYPDGSITKEAVDGFLYGGHLRASTIRRNELALCQLAEYAQAAGWDACTPAAATEVRVRHQPPYVLTDEEVRRLFAAIDSQAMSSFSNKAMVDPVLFRVLYGAGLRVSEALSLSLADVDTRAGTLRIRDSKNGQGRTIPITGRLTATLDAYTAAALRGPVTAIAPSAVCVQPFRIRATSPRLSRSVISRASARREISAVRYVVICRAHDHRCRAERGVLRSTRRCRAR